MGEEVGEVPKAFVVLKPNANIKPSDIEEFVERKYSANLLLILKHLMWKNFL